MSDSLYNRLGGSAAVDAAVDIFYRKALADDRISRFFDSVDMDRQSTSSRLPPCGTSLFGRPHGHTGRCRPCAPQSRSGSLRPVNS